MPVEYPHLRVKLAPFVADSDPNAVPPTDKDFFTLTPRPPFGGQNILTLSHSIYLTFEDVTGLDLPGGQVTFTAWEKDGSKGWVQINETPATLKQRLKLNGTGVQEAVLFLQLLTFTAPAGATQLTLHVTEQGTEADQGYGADSVMGTVIALQGTTPWVIQEPLLVDQGAPGASPWPVTEVDSPATTSTITDIPAAAVPTTLLAANASRLSVTIYNDSNRPLTVKCGPTPTATSRTTKIPPQMEWFPDVRYTGIITGFWPPGAVGSAAVTEYTP